MRILAPAPYQMEKQQEKTDANGQVIRDGNGEPVMETVKVTINAFKPVSTFDISQTDGEPLPQVGVAELVGNIEGYPTLMKAITETSPVPIGFEHISSGAKGYYSKTENRIAIQEGMSEVQTVKTALHEIAHAKYHSMEAMKDSGENKSVAQKECEAESMAYICAAHYGLNTSDYSFGYVAGWSSGQEAPELKASLQTIRKGACEIIDAIDEKIKSMSLEKAQDDFFETLEGMETPFDVPFDNAGDSSSVMKKLAENKAEADRTPAKPRTENNKEYQEAI